MTDARERRTTGWASTPGGRDVMRVGAGIVLGTAVGLGAAGLWAESTNVRFDTADGRGGGGVGVCSTMYQRSTVYIGDATNDEDGPVEIVSVKPTDTASGLRVEDFAFQPKPMQGSNAAASLPKLAHPHVLEAHERGSLSVLATGRDGSRTSGFDVELRSGGAHGTEHLDVSVAFDRDLCSKS